MKALHLLSKNLSEIALSFYWTKGDNLSLDDKMHKVTPIRGFIDGFNFVFKASYPFICIPPS